MSVSQSSSLTAFTLFARFPTVLREPLCASVTFWEATAPVKLPAWHCSAPGFTEMLLEAQYVKGGISRLAPRQPQPALPSLPPILSETHRTPIPGCSKGSRGLSVLPRVLGIFTETAISPSPSLRQRSTRYAIRAGRNLPDKEFRYLRTVIVTAAVYRGLVSVLWVEP